MKNKTVKPQVAPTPETGTKNYWPMLAIIGMFWILLLVIVLMEKAEELLPVAGLLGFSFVIFAVFATYKMWRISKK